MTRVPAVWNQLQPEYRPLAQIPVIKPWLKALILAAKLISKPYGQNLSLKIQIPGLALESQVYLQNWNNLTGQKIHLDFSSAPLDIPEEILT